MVFFRKSIHIGVQTYNAEEFITAEELGKRISEARAMKHRLRFDLMRETNRIDKEELELFRKNDWEIVDAAGPVHKYNADISFCYPSKEGGMYGPQWISMNTFALGPNTMCVEAHETAYMEQLDKMGIEVVPVPFDQVVPFGGSLHCNTLDIYRESSLEDYFPNQ